MNTWFKKALLRNVVDMHITELEPEFLSKLDPAEYARMLKRVNADSAVVYAQSHVGLCYYPTKSGHMHAGYRGEDLFGDLTQACHNAKVGVVAYYSVIFNSWAYDHHPSWRIVRANGSEAADGSRYGVCCPNSEYREFVRTQIREICEAYDFEGIRFDMTFWPSVCYCGSCRERFAEEVGGSMPRTVDWYDRRWTQFQRARERWLCDFAQLCTDTAHEAKPGVTVEHQASTFAAPWRFGVTEQLSEQNDFLQGDFYGDKLQGSFACKQFYNLSANLPYGFETSSNVLLSDHTTPKSGDLLAAKMFAALANGGAFVFIDAIDPIGTLHDPLYGLVKGVFEQIEPYRDSVGGALVQDVAIYLSTESKFSYEENGKPVLEASRGDSLPHIDAALGVARACIYHNIPWGVVTRRNLAGLSKFKVLVLPNLLVMDEGESDAIREFVRDGGTVIASGMTSLVSKSGDRRSDFLLADVFGVHARGETAERFTYIAPSSGEMFGSYYTTSYPLSVRDRQMIVAAEDTSDVLGHLVLPYSDPADTSRYASIHSNPPGLVTDHPALVRNSYGKGTSTYIAGPIESAHGDVFAKLLSDVLPGEPSFASNAPKPVEITMFRSDDGERLTVCLLNFQEEMPNIPVRNIEVSVLIEDSAVESVEAIPEGTQVEFATEGARARFTVDEVTTFRMFEVNLGKPRS